MTALLVTLVGVLTLLVVGVAVLALRLAGRIGRLEARLAASSDPGRSGSERETDQRWSLDAPTPVRDAPEYVITHLGDTGPDAEVEAAPTIPVAPTLPAGQFADVVLKETVIRSASLFHGVRRALSAENRNRIRFEMKREVKRSRKQRRADLREARREWEARQRAAMLDEQAVDERAGSAA